MHKLRKFMMQILSFHKYPRYVMDMYLKYVMQTFWRLHGIKLGDGIVWLGKPIINLASNSTLSIGSRCLICSRSSQTALGVNHSVVFRTLYPNAELRIGAGVRMSGTTICAAKKVSIGDRCVIGANSIIVDTDFHALDPNVRSTPDDFNSAISSPVEISDNVFIGVGCIILKGVKIGHGAVIGAGSVVTQDIAPRTIVAGNPAKFIAALDDKLVDFKKTSTSGNK